MKKFTTNLPRKIKCLFVSRGPGETGQARDLAKFLAKKNWKILFSLHQKIDFPFLEKDKEFKIFFTPSPKDLKKIIEIEKPEVLLLFNSKMWSAILKKSSFPRVPLSLGVDSNWLFNNKIYPSFKFIEWLDRYLVLFPEKIFKLGLKKYGGNFIIPEKILKKILPVGFIPFYQKPKKETISKIRKKYQIQKGEKFIFSYFSGFGAGHRIFAFNNLISAVEKLIKKGEKIKVLYVGPSQDLNFKKLKKKWLLKIDFLPANEYFLTLASSDLIFQHQGLVTLSQAISAQVPVICNVHVLKNASLPKIHFWEVSPFKNAGVCEMLSKSTPVKKISQKIEELLFNEKKKEKMVKKQKLLAENGKIKTFKVINNLLKEKI